MSLPFLFAPDCGVGSPGMPIIPDYMSAHAKCDQRDVLKNNGWK
jgi:hypothetical protein